MKEKPILGIIGGSGLYSMSGLKEAQEFEINTPFGDPSGPIVTGIINNRNVAFLARHGVGHFISPTEINYRANIYALKTLGVERIISISACGSLREDYAPGDIVIPDQLFDFTHHRVRSFFGDGHVAHISAADPFCPDLSRQLSSAMQSVEATIHQGGTFITIEGPRFSTRAESNVYRSWGMSIIGMTTSPEAFLAREAEICYAVMAHVTDYDVWHTSEQPVTVEMVIEILIKNARIAEKAVKNLAGELITFRDCDCGSTLEDALITNPEKIPVSTQNKLDLLLRN